MKGDDTSLDELVENVRSSPKYRDVSRDLVHSVAAQELPKYQTRKEAIKATRSKLHQVVGAYSHKPEYALWLAELTKAYRSNNHEEVLRVSTHVMKAHTSTRERLPVLGDFYTSIFESLPPIHIVLDVACGLNPIALPWMPLADEFKYHAYDADGGLIRFVKGFLKVAGARGDAQVLDATNELPKQSADIALVLKVLPCLDQLDPSAGPRLLEGLDAHYLLVSFPLRSLSGRSKGMVRMYDARFSELVAGKNWGVRRFEFATELTFLIMK